MQIEKYSLSLYSRTYSVIDNIYASFYSEYYKRLQHKKRVRKMFYKKLQTMCLFGWTVTYSFAGYGGKEKEETWRKDFWGPLNVHQILGKPLKGTPEQKHWNKTLGHVQKKQKCV